MLQTKHFYYAFIPAILIASFALFIRIIQYQPVAGSKKNNTEVNQQEKNKILIPIYDEDPIIGSKKSALTLIAFEDFGCKACKTQNTLLDELQQKYPNKIKIIWKGLSVSKFPYETTTAHKYAFCANKQNKFLDFKNLAFANNEKLSPGILEEIANQMKLDSKKLEECLTSEEPQNYLNKIEKLAMSLNIQSVPTIFYNNKQIQPPQSIEGWENFLKLKQ